MTRGEAKKLEGVVLAEGHRVKVNSLSASSVYLGRGLFVAGVRGADGEGFRMRKSWPVGEAKCKDDGQVRSCRGFVSRSPYVIREPDSAAYSSGQGTKGALLAMTETGCTGQDCTAGVGRR
jgi:hypothetical protein